MLYLKMSNPDHLGLALFSSYLAQHVLGFPSVSLIG